MSVSQGLSILVICVSFALHVAPRSVPVAMTSFGSRGTSGPLAAILVWSAEEALGGRGLLLVLQACWRIGSLKALKGIKFNGEEGWDPDSQP